jgi:hypothetical protein
MSKIPVTKASAAILKEVVKEVARKSERISKEQQHKQHKESHAVAKREVGKAKHHETRPTRIPKPTNNKNHSERQYVPRDRFPNAISLMRDRGWDTFKVRCEEIGIINGTIGSIPTPCYTFYVNAGNSYNHQIFANIAATYEEFQLVDYALHVQSESYEAINAVGAAGKIVIAPFYNPACPFPTDATNLKAALNSDDVVWQVPYKNFTCRPKIKNRGKAGKEANAFLVNYSSNVPLPLTTLSGYQQSIGDYCPMGMQVWTTGNTVNTELALLYVEYSYRMARPTLPNANPFNPLVAHYIGTPVNAKLFGNATVTAQTGSSGTIVCSSVTNTLSLASSPPINNMKYKIDLVLNAATSISAGVALASVDSATSVVNEFEGDTVNVATLTATPTSMWSGVFTTTNGSSTLVFDSVATVTGTGTLDIFVTILPTSLITVSADERLKHLEEKEIENATLIKRLASQLAIQEEKQIPGTPSDMENSHIVAESDQ